MESIISICIIILCVLIEYVYITKAKKYFRAIPENDTSLITRKKMLKEQRRTILKLKLETRKYAKRQETYFKNKLEVILLDGTKTISEKVLYINWNINCFTFNFNI